MSRKELEYKTLVEKCVNKIGNAAENIYQIDTVGFLWVKNQIYVLNQLNIK